MNGNYLGYYMMHEPQLEAYKRLILTQFSKGQDSNILMSAYLARIDRQEKRATLYSEGSHAYDLRSAKRKNTATAPIIEIEGSLSRHGECNYGYEELGGIIRAGALDKEVRVMGLKIDSGGGGVDGVVYAAESIKFARKHGKRVMAWGGYIGSAAYLLASQCDEVWMDAQKVSSIGSIGVLEVYMNEQKRLDKKGIEVEIIRAEGSEDKARMNPYEELTDDVRAEEKKILKELRGEFVGYVRRGRTGKLTSNEWDSAKMFNSRDAIRIGLADKVGGLNDFLNYINNF